MPSQKGRSIVVAICCKGLCLKVSKRRPPQTSFWASKWWPNELRNFENPNNWPSPTPVEVDLLLQQRGLKVNTTWRPKRMEEGVKWSATTSLSPKEILGKKTKVTHKLHGFLENSKLQHVQLSNHSAFVSNCSDTKKIYQNSYQVPHAAPAELTEGFCWRRC